MGQFQQYIFIPHWLLAKFVTCYSDSWDVETVNRTDKTGRSEEARTCCWDYWRSDWEERWREDRQLDIVWHGDKEKERDKEGIKEAEVAGDDWEDEDRVKIDRDLADSG